MKKNKKLLLALSSSALILLTGAYAIARYMVYVILDRNSKHQESTDDLTTDPEDLKKAIIMLTGTDEWKAEVAEIAEDWNITSYDDLKLYARFLKNDSNKFIILCHGFTGSHREMVGRAEHFYRKGYNVLLPDARSHGSSEGTYRGMGYLETKDIKQWIDKIIASNPEAEIVLMGQSMGAATVMMTASTPLPTNVKCVIEDCGYTGVYEEFSQQISQRYHVPSFPIMNIANVLSKKIAGYSFKEASPVNMIKNCHLPILMIHGTEDAVVPYEFLDQLYEAANEPKEKLTVEGAGHCMSMVIETDLYWNTIDSFIEKHL